MRKAYIAVITFMLTTSNGFTSGLETPLPIEIKVAGIQFAFSNNTIFMCAFAALALFFFIFWCTRGMNLEKPTRRQMVVEMIVSALDGLCKQSLGPNRGRAFLPYIGTLFLFIWMSNMSGIFEFVPLKKIPHGVQKFDDYNGNGQWDPKEPIYDKNGKMIPIEENPVHHPGFPMPSFEEPTKNLTVPLGLALLFVLLIGHGAGMRYNGIKGYLAEYIYPGGIIGMVMLPLNLVGKVSEIVSISFRLFGSTFGGSVILVIVGGLLHSLILPPFMLIFFGMILGTIQAFVFTMLSLTYISSNAAEAHG